MLYLAGAIRDFIHGGWKRWLAWALVSYVALIVLRAILPGGTPVSSDMRRFASGLRGAALDLSGKVDPVIHGKLLLIADSGGVSPLQSDLPLYLAALRPDEVGTVGAVSSAAYETGWYEVHSSNRERAKSVYVNLFEPRTSQPLGLVTVTRTSWGAWVIVSDWDVADRLAHTPHVSASGAPLELDLAPLEWVRLRPVPASGILACCIWLGLFVKQQRRAGARTPRRRDVYW